MKSDDPADYSMEELFRAEAEAQCAALSNNLLMLESAKDPAPLLENLMRAAHSLKGAARITGLDRVVPVAHIMEDLFIKAQKKNASPGAAAIDLLLNGVDLLARLSGVAPGEPSQEDVKVFIRLCGDLPTGESPKAAPVPPPPAVPSNREPSETPPRPATPAQEASQRRDVRMDSERLDTLLSLAGEAVVASEAGKTESPARKSLRHLQAMLAEIQRAGDETRRLSLLSEAMALLSKTHTALVGEHEERDIQAQRISRLCHRIYNETLAGRLRPFGDITPGLRRLARDVARSLGREVRVEISGEDTEVDRDLLDRLDGPLAHLIRNSLDHGIETPDEREKLGKVREGTLRISARHQAGWLVVGVSDDGRGLDYAAIQAAVVGRGLASEDHVAVMPETELLDFLLLPGFSLRKEVTEISGRGIGLDAVRATAYGAGGSLRLAQGEKGGFVCEISLPVSLSLVRALVLEIAGDFFALPLTRVERVLRLAAEEIHAAAGRQHAFLDGERVEILSAAQVLELDGSAPPTGSAQIIVVRGPQGRLGLAVDRLVGQRELSLQRLDPRLGRLQNVSATALLDNGEPVVMLDVNDLAITAANFSSGTRYRPLLAEMQRQERTAVRILVADDSLTVRELERKLLISRGYVVETAVDGADAWNALRNGHYDLLVTDIDMPRLDGIELVRLVRADARLRDLAVIVVSYKDREEDRARGLEAGADFYLPKSSYQDESLLNAVQELIAEPR